MRALRNLAPTASATASAYRLGRLPRPRVAALAFAASALAASGLSPALELGSTRPTVVDGDISEWPDARAILQATATDDDIIVAVRLPHAAILSDLKNLSLAIASATDPAGDVLTWHFGEGRLTRQPTGEIWTGATAEVSVVPPFRTRTFEWQLSRHEAPGVTLSGSLRVSLIEATADGSAAIATTVVTLPAAAERSRDLPSALPRPEGVVRIFSLNAESSALMDPRRGEALARLVRATTPDILVLQELYAPSFEEVAARLQALLPGGAWTVAKRGLDLVVATRLPRLEATLLHTFPEHGSIASFDVWLKDSPSPIQIINAHLPCCRPQGVEDKRRLQIDAAIAHARQRREQLPGVPVLLFGDLNLVGNDSVLEHLKQSDAAGPWHDLAPARPTRPTTATWRVSGSRFPPSRLDYALMTNASPSGARAFILDTRTLPASWLASHGLERGDSDAASDHQAIILDLPKPRSPSRP